MSTAKATPLVRSWMHSSRTSMLSTPISSMRSRSTLVMPFSSGGSQRSWLTGGRPGRKKTASAFLQPEMAVPLLMAPPFTTRSTLRKEASRTVSTTSFNACWTWACDARLKILLCKSKYCWFSAELRVWATSAAAERDTFAPSPGGGSMLSETFSEPPLSDRRGCGFHATDLDFKPTRRRSVTTKRSRSFIRNSAGFIPAMLERLMLNFATNLAHNSLISIEPVLLAFKMDSTSSTTEKGFSEVSSRTRAT
mmetsp:Transcript_3115/g.12102  ORF Transcript_3115/g.12102 Transcript_3115/m.12102 type:complete len:251 (-) Transcript_3115:572-1324(-)